MKRKRRRLKPDSATPGGHGVRAPKVAIVGRPNVGKSALFNRLVGKKISIVEPTAGVTRDRISAVIELKDDKLCELIDTGGLGGSTDTLAEDVDRQIAIALDYADYILFVVDARDGVTALDKTIARRVGRLNKKVVLCANKCETMALEENAVEFWELGLTEPVPVSAVQALGLEDLRDALADMVPAEDVELPPEDQANREMRLAIIGRRNVGKSTYVNKLFGEERVLVSDMPGTTRDSIDMRVELGDIGFTLIDTAGLRRRGRLDDAIEAFAQMRAREAVARSDVVLLFLEAANRVSLVDKHLARMIAEEFKACVLVGTKWDIVGNRMDLETYAQYLEKYLPGLTYCPKVLLSSQDSLNVEGPIRAALDLWEQAKIRVPTSKINRCLRDAYDKKRPRVRRNILPRIYFATQIRANPITIIVFCNKPSLFGPNYRRYLAKHLREVLPFKEVPIKFIFRERVNIFEKGLHNRIRRIKAIDDKRFLSQDGVEEAPVDSQENVEELFGVLFGERPTMIGESLDDLLEVAQQNPELFTDEDELMPEGFKDEGEHVFIENDGESPVPEELKDIEHPMGENSQIGQE